MRQKALPRDRRPEDAECPRNRAETGNERQRGERNAQHESQSSGDPERGGREQTAGRSGRRRDEPWGEPRPHAEDDRRHAAQQHRPDRAVLVRRIDEQRRTADRHPHREEHRREGRGDDARGHDDLVGAMWIRASAERRQRANGERARRNHEQERRQGQEQVATGEVDRRLCHRPQNDGADRAAEGHPNHDPRRRRRTSEARQYVQCDTHHEHRRESEQLDRAVDLYQDGPGHPKCRDTGGAREKKPQPEAESGRERDRERAGGEDDDRRPRPRMTGDRANHAISVGAWMRALLRGLIGMTAEIEPGPRPSSIFAMCVDYAVGSAVANRAGGACSAIPSGPASTYTSIATKPKLRIPSTSRTTNQVLSSSLDVFSTAPIHATNCVIPPPNMPTHPRTARASIVHANAVGSIPTTSGPFMTRAPLAYAARPAPIERTSPPAIAIRPPTNSLVIIDFVIFFSVLRVSRFAGRMTSWTPPLTRPWRMRAHRPVRP